MGESCGQKQDGPVCQAELPGGMDWGGLVILRVQNETLPDRNHGPRFFVGPDFSSSGRLSGRKPERDKENKVFRRLHPQSSLQVLATSDREHSELPKVEERSSLRHQFHNITSTRLLLLPLLNLVLQEPKA